MYEYKILQVVKVVDGDTIDVIIDVGFDILRKERVRINRVDTPEVSSKDELERKLANEAKQFITEWFKSQSSIYIKTTKDDKYGRILGEIFNNDNEYLNTILIDRGYAWEYFGGTKNKDLSLLLEKRKNYEN